MTNRVLNLLVCSSTFFVLLICLLGCQQKITESIVPKNVVPEPKSLDTQFLYTNGSILTMAGDQAEYVEALVTDHESIVYTGQIREATRKYPKATLVNLKGKALLPGFIDPHSHFTNAYTTLHQANVGSPPVGTVTDINSLLNALKTYQTNKVNNEDKWILAWGYDQSELDEARHITKDELDEVFPDHKVVLIHVSGHGAVLNSKALEWAGIDESTETPVGGVIGRMENSDDLSGLLMETSWLAIQKNLPNLTKEDKLAAIPKIMKLYASEGYTSIQDAACFLEELDILKIRSNQERLLLDIAVLPIFIEGEQWLNNPEYTFGNYSNGLKLQGVKLIQDGSPQGKTAFMTKDYLTGGLSGEAIWTGDRMFAYQQFESFVKHYASNGIQLFIHANGDAAIDDVIKAVRNTGITAADDRRTVVIHSQFQRPDHLDDYVALGLSPSYFTNHCFFWGDEHVKNQGIERASHISPLESASNKGIVYSNHSDYIVTPLDPFFILWTATNRISRSGIVLGEDQRVSMFRALQGLTTGPAWQLFEEDKKGKLKPGFVADMIIVDKDPITLQNDEIKDCKIIQTIKRGKVVYENKDE